jgi:hypothetical protein
MVNNFNRATELVKRANAKHKGILFYINKNKKLGIHPPKKTGIELMKAKKTILKAKKKAQAKGHG